jgi:hypothetical protein
MRTRSSLETTRSLWQNKAIAARWARLAFSLRTLSMTVGERIAPCGTRRLWVEVAGSDQDRSVRLEPTSPYLVRGLPFDVLPVLPKCTF